MGFFNIAKFLRKASFKEIFPWLLFDLRINYKKIITTDIEMLDIEMLQIVTGNFTQETREKNFRKNRD